MCIYIYAYAVVTILPWPQNVEISLLTAMFKYFSFKMISMVANTGDLKPFPQDTEISSVRL